MKNIDKDILLSLQTGRNEKVLNNLYEKIFPKIRKYICSNSGSSEDAIDIFQDAIVILCRQVKTGKFEIKYDIEGFLFAVCKNLWINKAKRESRMVSFQKSDESGYIYDYTPDIITKEKTKTLKEMIQKLGEKCFRLLHLAVYQQLDNNEICTTMGFATVNAVKTQKYKCKQKLLKLIESDASYKEVLD